MTEDDLEELRQLELRLGRTPTDLELAWDLCHFHERTGLLPRGVGAGYIPVLVTAWYAAPEVRTPDPLFHRLMGLEPWEADSVPEWWFRTGRARFRDGRVFDRWTGLPVLARRREDGRVMVLVPAGEFLMGADELGDDVGPLRTVELDSYYIDRDPVPRELLMPGGPGLTWDEALAYAEEVGGRLPSEAELERAMRGDDGRRFPWGEGDPPERACSPFGLSAADAPTFYACDDVYAAEAFEHAPRRNPRHEPEGEGEKVARGGSPLEGEGWAHCARRAHVRAGDRWQDLGLRVVFAVGPAVDGFPEPGEGEEDGPEPRDTVPGMTHEDIAESLKQADPLAPREGAWYLDLGCGAGQALSTLAPRGGIWVGLDVRAGELAKAREAAPAAHLIRAKGGKLPFRDGCFAGALCIEGLARFEKLEHPLEQVARVLQPGGIFLVIEEELDAEVVHPAFDAAGFDLEAGGAQKGVLVARKR